MFFFFKFYIYAYPFRMLLPVLICHLRFHKSLDVLEDRIKYRFKNRYLLQLALTHPSYRENFGTNPDHARNSLTNCGIRQPEYGDRRIHYMNTRKRGINTLINIMSRYEIILTHLIHICICIFFPALERSRRQNLVSLTMSDWNS